MIKYIFGQNTSGTIINRKYGGVLFSDFKSRIYKLSQLSNFQDVDFSINADIRFFTLGFRYSTLNLKSK